MDTGARPADPEDDCEKDSLERFTADLQDLRRRRGGHGYKALATRMGLGHGSVYAALAQDGRLPSAYVLERMITHWSPDAVQDWLARRAALAAPNPEINETIELALDPPLVDKSPIVGRSRSRRRFVLPLVGILGVVGLVAAVTPIHAGGVDMWEYCFSEYGDQVANPPAQISDAHAGWDCVLLNGRRVAADMSKACRDQHPPLTSWGRTYVEHAGNGATSWRCVTSQLALLSG